MTPEGDRVPGVDGRGQGWYRNSPTTRKTEASGDSGSTKEMTSRSGPAALPSSQQGTAVGIFREVRPHRPPGGADGTRPERASEYGLLAPVNPAGDPAAAELQERGDGHKATMRTGGLDTR